MEFEENKDIYNTINFDHKNKLNHYSNDDFNTSELLSLLFVVVVVALYFYVGYKVFNNVTGKGFVDFILFRLFV